ncbi:hypothetical protein AB2B38_012665 [Balneola sp. MJW-20]|uniref:hypothetical protein n=1 Tax=Gracilimonas aurantiaca TaxID=3234185 RepID=UPI0034675AB5
MTQSNIALTFKHSLLLAILLASFNHSVFAQATGTEVPLTFQYEGVISSYISSVYQEDEFYLATTELLNVMDIPYELDQGALTIRGELNGEIFVINLRRQVATYRDISLSLVASDFLINELDYFIRPKVFLDLLELNFTVDFNNLRLSLETPYEIPRVAQFKRAQKRNQLDRAEIQTRRAQYPILYDRKPALIDGAFLDYNVNGIITNNSSLLTMNNTIGTEFLGGDLQGSLFSVFSQNGTRTQSNNLRLRYVSRNTPYFTTALIGQSSAQGFVNRQITGIQISDRPIEPRLLFDRYIVDGEAPPQSEVELYLNNRLIDYQEANEVGYYRFVVPLTYGNTDYQVRIYTPSGRSIERSRRIQIPFNYLPPGEIDYNVSFGRLDNPLQGSSNQDYQTAATVGAGITNWLSVQGSSEYLSEYHQGSSPTFTGTLNARLFSQYLVSLSANSESVLQLNSNVVFSSGANFNFSHTQYGQENSIYNLAGIDQNTSLSVFTPLPIKLFPLNIRVTGSYQEDQGNSRFRYRTDLNSRLGRVNVRLGYSDQQVGGFRFDQSLQSRLFTSLTYSLRRSRDLPNYIRGAFLRGQISYLPGLQQFEETGVQISKEILRTGRLQFGINRNFVGNFTSLTLTMNIDFRNFRTNTSAVTGSGNYTINQGIQGSVIYDPYNKNLFLSNREQVGQSGLGVRLFVDNDNNGTYNEDQDQIIEDQAVRLSFAGERSQISNGVNYIGQLLPYFQYDVEINKAALKNPLLVPELEKFSIVTDPNQYKPLEVPFYMSGVISGNVNLHENDRVRGLGGVRLYLQEANADSTSQVTELPTFSDGSFYTYEVAPGKYDLFVDPNQLRFLNAVSRPDTLKLEVKALAEGDFIEGLEFNLYKEGQLPTKEDSLITEAVEEEVTTIDYSDTNTAIDSAFVDPEIIRGIEPLNPLPAYRVPKIKTGFKSPEQISTEEELFLLETYFNLSKWIEEELALPLPFDPTPIPVPGNEIDQQADSISTDSTGNNITTDDSESVTEDQEKENDNVTLIPPPVDEIDVKVIDENNNQIQVIDESVTDSTNAEVSTGELMPADSLVPDVSSFPFPVIEINETDSTDSEETTIQEELTEDGFPVPRDTISVGPPALDDELRSTEKDDEADYVQKSVDLIQMPPPVFYYSAASDHYFRNTSTDTLYLDQSAQAVVELTNRRFDSSPISRSPDELLAFRRSVDSVMQSRPAIIPESEDKIPEISAPVTASEIDYVTLSPGSCSYSMQLSSYRSLEAATRLSLRSGLSDSYILHNTSADLYGIRGGNYDALSEAANAVKAEITPSLYDASVLIQCHTEKDEEYPAPEFINDIHFGFPFTDLYDARQRSIEINDEFDLTTRVYTYPDSMQFAVSAGGFENVQSSRNELERLEALTGLQNLRLINRPADPVSRAVTFSYEIQVGSYAEAASADSLRKELLNTLSVNSRILREENGRYLVVTSEEISKWYDFLKLRDRIRESGFPESIIHLTEYLN